MKKTIICLTFFFSMIIPVSGQLIIEDSKEKPYLASFKISEKKVFPDIKRNADHLLELEISSCEFDVLPSYLDSFDRLWKLDIGYTPIKRLPNIPNLKELLISNMSEKEFFSSVLELKRLKKLKATFQTIKGVPPSFEGLKNLEELFFDVCTTTEKDFENLLRNLPNLEVMILAGLKGSSLPKTIKYLTNLKHLEIQYSEIDTLPKEVNKLKSLTYLNIAHSKIIGIPKAVYKLKNLERFVVSSKKISAQDEETLKKKLPNCEIIVIDW